MPNDKHAKLEESITEAFATFQEEVADKFVEKFFEDEELRKAIEPRIRALLAEIIK